MALSVGTLGTKTAAIDFWTAPAIMLSYRQAYDADRLILIYPLHRETDGPEGLNREWTNAGTKRRMHIATADFRHPHKTVEAPRNITSSDTGLGPPMATVSVGRPRG